MKGEQANYVIGLEKAFLFPPKTRVKKAITQIRKFVKKHTRMQNFALSNEVNEYLHKHSKNIPKKIPATLLREPNRIVIFLQNGKALPEYIKKNAEKKKEQKESKKEEKKDKAEKTPENDTEKKLEEKKAKEDAAKAADIKRKTGK